MRDGEADDGSFYFILPEGGSLLQWFRPVSRVSGSHLVGVDSLSVKNLFQFNRHESQRRKKRRGALRQALRVVATITPPAPVLSPENWFHCWHQHLDWDGSGDASLRLRRIFLEAHARLFLHLASQAHRLGQPYQIWIGLSAADAGQDAVYLHTANPNSEFPIIFPNVRWGLPELIALFTPWLPELSLAAGRAGDALFLYAEEYGVSLEQRDSA